MVSYQNQTRSLNQWSLRGGGGWLFIRCVVNSVFLGPSLKQMSL